MHQQMLQFHGQAHQQLDYFLLLNWRKLTLTLPLITKMYYYKIHTIMAKFWRSRGRMLSSHENELSDMSI